MQDFSRNLYELNFRSITVMGKKISNRINIFTTQFSKYWHKFLENTQDTALQPICVNQTFTSCQKGIL